MICQAAKSLNATRKIEIPAHPLIVAKTNDLCILHAVEEDVDRREEIQAAAFDRD